MLILVLISPSAISADARTDLITAIFGQSTLPAAEPTIVSQVNSDPVGVFPSWIRLDYTTTVGNNSGYYYVPPNFVDRFVIVLQGHTPGIGDLGITELAQELYAAGFAIAVFGMPGLHSNSGSSDHDTYTSLEPFIGPIIGAINWIAGNGWTRIGITGLSGGGWGADIVAAIDERVKITVEVSGSLPWFMRGSASMGDWEQQVVVNTLDYPAIYALGTTAGRRRVQILREFDDCCFGKTGTSGAYGANYDAQIVEVIDSVASLTGGSFAWIETSETIHQISPANRAVIMTEMENL